MRSINKKVKEEKLSSHLVDVSINGYSNKYNFDFEVNGIKWSSLRHHFKKGDDAQKDPDALTVKRGIRSVAKVTTEYILKKNVTPYLTKYNTSLPKEYCHLGAAYVVPKEHAQALLELWQSFDKEKETSVALSTERILNARNLL